MVVESFASAEGASLSGKGGLGVAPPENFQIWKP